MTEINELSDAEKDFMLPYLPQHGNGLVGHGSSEGTESSTVLDEDTTFKPFVTLTYACSLDSMISLAPGVRTALSGPETKSMTHYLRLHHDAILIGVGTATADDPSLNCRYPGTSLDSQPQPVIVDAGLRWNVIGSKVAKLAAAKESKTPWILHAPCEPAEREPSLRHCERIPVNSEAPQLSPTSSQTRLRKLLWPPILDALRRKGIKSVMIEGGAQIINDLLSQSDLVDSVIVTIAPTWLGQGGLAVSPAPKIERSQRVNAAHLGETAWRQFGDDVVLCGKLKQ